jgi:hypothetical protein
LQLLFRNNTEDLELSSYFRPSISSYNRRVGIQKRFANDGGKITGDENVDPRTITIRYEPVFTNDTAYLNLLNTIIGFFRVELAPFYLVDTDNNRRTEIRLTNATDNAHNEGNELKIGKNDLVFKMVNSYWEDLTETEINSDTSGLANGETLTVNNSGKFRVRARIHIRPSDGNTNFQIKNNTTGEGFLLGSNSFVPGSEFIVDGVNGTINLDNGVSEVDSSAAFADGSGFISLYPGNNEIEYISAFAAVDIDVLFRRRYAF